MERRRSGKSCLELSVLGAGCWAFGGGEYWGHQDQKDVDAVVARALELGINYFDTAEAYNAGASEQSLGQALKGRRDKAIIGTKISPSNCYAHKAAEHCETSLRRLGADVIDLYMIHWPLTPRSLRHFTSDQALIDSPPSPAEAFGALEKLQRRGKIRYIGVSNFAATRLGEALEACDQIAVNELPYSLLTRAIELETIGACHDSGVGVIGYMTLMQGLLADIYPTLDDLPKWQRRVRHFDSRRCELTRHGENGAEAETLQALQDIRRIMAEVGLTMPQIAVKWALANPRITCALVGARNVAELEDDVQAAATPLPAEIVERLNVVTRPVLDRLGKGFDYYESPANDRTI
jgi:aryl-alcohol dehydrogenase-like predicted oxidoreductase